LLDIAGVSSSPRGGDLVEFASLVDAVHGARRVAGIGRENECRDPTIDQCRTVANLAILKAPSSHCILLVTAAERMSPSPRPRRKRWPMDTHHCPQGWARERPFAKGWSGNLPLGAQFNPEGRSRCRLAAAAANCFRWFNRWLLTGHGGAGIGQRLSARGPTSLSQIGATKKSCCHLTRAPHNASSRLGLTWHRHDTTICA
jgi:hypothetical protein